LITDRPLRCAVVQAAPVAFDPIASTAKAIALCEQAKAQGAELVVFPEAFLSGYPRGLGFGAVVGDRSHDGRELFRRYFESAIEIPGPEIARLADAVAKLGIYLVIGAVERVGGTLYCDAVYLAPDGALLGKHRKLMPTGSERLIWGCGDASTLIVFETPIGRLGGAICWENYMPLLRMALYQQQIQLWCAPTADGRDSWLASMRHIAAEGRCFVLSCNQFARRADYPADYPAFADDPDEIITNGGSVIVGPLGEILAGPNYEAETILVADLDLAETIRGKYDFDVVGHYARPDLFSLTVDRRPKAAVTVIEEAQDEPHSDLGSASQVIVQRRAG
jgi:nitrilase